MLYCTSFGLGINNSSTELLVYYDVSSKELQNLTKSSKLSIDWWLTIVSRNIADVVATAIDMTQFE
jgi:hypothetical protein